MPIVKYKEVLYSLIRFYYEIVQNLNTRKEQWMGGKLEMYNEKKNDTKMGYNECEFFYRHFSLFFFIASLYLSALGREYVR